MLSSLFPLLIVLNLVQTVDIQTWLVNISTDNTYEFNSIWWNNFINSGHAALTLRQDWRAQIKSTNNILKFNMIRFHGIFDDDVGSVNNINDYSFINIDKIYKHLISINIKPYVEISFLPYLFSSNNCAGNIIENHYKPCAALPNDYNIWYNFIQQWTQHLLNVFGINEMSSWKFEVWNEANNIGWSFNQYLKFYNYTVTAIKSVNNKLIVGGPATGAEAWIAEFCNATKVMNIPVDFISTHAYPNHVTNGIKPNYLNSYYDAINKLLNQVKPYNLPIYISEYDSWCCGGQQASFYYNDNYYAASFLIFMVNHLQSLFVNNSLLKSMAYWEVSDIVEEKGFISDEFSNYWGLTTIRGIYKPVFRAFELLKMYVNNSTVKYLSYNMDNIGVMNNTVELFCIKGIDNHYTVFISNWNLLNLNITDKMLNIYISNYINNKLLSSVVMYRIDANSTNPIQTWRDMSSPTYPTMEQLNKLNESSKLVPITNVNYTQINATTVGFGIKLPIYGVIVLDLEY